MQYHCIDREIRGDKYLISIYIGRGGATPGAVEGVGSNKGYNPRLDNKYFFRPNQ